MKYVIIRDDDTNAFTPPAILERLYSPFLDRGLPVNLATIPAVRTDARNADGEPEGFLFGHHVKDGEETRSVPIGTNTALVDYLHANRLFNVVQHGLYHALHEFERCPREEAARRLEAGTAYLHEAGFEKPCAFVAPHDKLSSESYAEVTRRFSIVSSGWFELGRLPRAWWPRYAVRKFSGTPHWRANNGALLLSHPGCLLSHHRSPGAILDTIRANIASRRVTVLVTHWWEYFPGGQPNEAFISVLHETADYLAQNRDDIRVIKFNDLLTDSIPLN